MLVRQRRLYIAILLVVSGSIFFARSVLAEILDSVMTDEVYMIKGELVSLSVAALTRISISDPDVIDIVNAEENEILLVGQGSGQTALFIWDEQGKRTVMVYVFERDLELTSYAPLKIPGLEWMISNTIKLEEVIAPKFEGEEKDYFANYIDSYGYYDLFLIGPGGFVFYTVTLVQPTIFALRGYLKKRDSAWFLHPYICLSFLFGYGFAVVQMVLLKIKSPSR